MKALSPPVIASLLTLAALTPITAQVWTRLPPAASPPKRTDHEMAYDASRNEVVLFGGQDGPKLFGDTWLWNGARWRKAPPGPSPSPRRNHAMAYDPRRQVVVLYGGNNLTPPDLQDTWEWDGQKQSWKLVCPPPCPPSTRTGHAMAYDPVIQQVLLFGASNRQETWAWNGQIWSIVATSGPPLPRWEHRLVSDPFRRRIVMFGGQLLRVGEVDDTWEWDGTAWTQICGFSSCGPPSRQSYGMAFDGSRVVLFGGSGATTIYSDTWQWDGTRWIRCWPSVSPSARAGHAMVYDSARGRVVLFGGGPTSAPLADTWELGRFVTGPGSARPGTAVTLTLNAGTCDGNLLYQLGSSFGSGSIPIGKNRTIGLSLDPLLLLSIQGCVPPPPCVFESYAGRLDRKGKGQAKINIPPIQKLVGLTIHSAFVTFDSQAPQGIKSISSTHSFQIR